MSNEPKALALDMADDFEADLGRIWSGAEVAAELRRLHEAHEWQYAIAGERLRSIEKQEAEIERLRTQLEALRKDNL